MNFRTIIQCSVLLVQSSMFATPGVAGPRTSAGYSITTDTTDSGGARATSAAYTNDASAGNVSGLSSVAAPAELAKSGYIGQLYEVTALQLAASPTTINETGTRQLGASQLLDDLTTLGVSSSVVSWSVLNGPISSISAGGLATAATVYQNTNASVQGSYAGLNGSLNLTVLDTIADNFGGYAGDGLGDDWQVQYFGQPPNANAGPLVDFDGDGQDNRFEFIAGLVPTDALSRFQLRIEPVPGQPGQKNVIFSPLMSGRTYAVKSAATLGGAMSPLSGSTTSDNGNERTVTDTAASGTAKFYTVEINKP